MLTLPTHALPTHALPTHDRLLATDPIGGLTGMASALVEQRRSTAFDDLAFEERLGLLVEREAAERDGKKLASRRKFAALRQDASATTSVFGIWTCARRVAWIRRMFDRTIILISPCSGRVIIEENR